MALRSVTSQLRARNKDKVATTRTLNEKTKSLLISRFSPITMANCLKGSGSLVNICREQFRFNIEPQEKVDSQYTQFTQLCLKLAAKELLLFCDIMDRNNLFLSSFFNEFGWKLQSKKIKPVEFQLALKLSTSAESTKEQINNMLMHFRGKRQ